MSRLLDNNVDVRAETASLKRDKRLILIDDNLSNNAHEVAKFEDDGFTVKLAESTSEAVKAIVKRLVPDVVITGMGREESAEYVTNAGLIAIRELQTSDIRVPIYVYTTQLYTQ